MDWWALGITCYKLLVNNHPFDTSMIKDALSTDPTDVHISVNLSRYSSLFAAIDYSELLEYTDAVVFIGKLLTVNELDRLGMGANGSNDIKRHPFFSGIDWWQLEIKAIPPPYIPPPGFSRSGNKSRNTIPKNSTLEQFLKYVGKKEWTRKTQLDAVADNSSSGGKTDTNNKQLPDMIFNTWDYSSPLAAVTEFNASKSGNTFADSVRIKNKQSSISVSPSYTKSGKSFAGSVRIKNKQSSISVSPSY